MSKYKQFFTNHALLKQRCVEICRLFHKHDPDLYPDILEEDLLFVFDERNTITVINNAHYKYNEAANIKDHKTCMDLRLLSKKLQIINDDISNFTKH